MATQQFEGKKAPESGAPKNNSTNKSQPFRRHRKPKPKKPEESNSTTAEIEGASAIAGNDEEENEDVEHCFICTEPISCYSVGACNHRTCHLCSLRLRALYKNKSCGYCKAELDSVVFTKDPETPFEAFTLAELPARDEKTSVYFHSQDLCDETLIILRYNCPDSSCDFHSENGWRGLKEHVRTVHHRSLCDICIKHKKVFTHEHTLFTRAQLQKHMSVGDSQDPNSTTGFKGHPDCQFCRASFYDGDQLFEHCRRKHEQCHICVRNGSGRNDYYANYNTLEQHFLKDHFLCTHQECLDKKFIVFDSDIDLKAHLVQEHRGVASQRSQLRQTRQLEVNFTYSDNNRSRGRNRDQDNSHRREGQNNRAEAGNRHNERRKDSKHGKAKERVQPPPEFGSALSEQTPGPSNTPQERESVRDKAPANFGRLTDNGSSTLPSPALVDDETLSNHTAFMERLSGYLGKNAERLSSFKQLIAAYRRDLIPVSQFLDSIKPLVPTSKDSQAIIGKIVNGLVDLLDVEEKKQELLSAWRDRKIQKTQEFPQLVPTGAAKQVLVIKSKTSKANQPGGNGKTRVWDRVAAAAQGPSARSNSPTLFPALPSVARPSTSHTTTAWSGRSTPHFVSPAAPKKNPAEDFPSLPAAPKPPKIKGISSRGKSTDSVWGKQKESLSADMENLELHNGKKKKGKQVLLHYG
ncbi:hypothetical protein K493DRAFT_251512 [Basidiobolus meristosporus CBS 931.73]|uniref:RING-type E3 ubiquitin transferase n=1 Tax=Basidiobolus meristosporus CBS 931.73 TaxID=1314790 RepID=A0A1Y1Z9T9_9FUNG|nr:hypothetical protein K493DRAFT_251512 [Basidiobolus meristosporus CBS 931.73]|eukprot:ORY06797.1 hypothetical protein K493DRAFT_251512 [Basidiobolus meristosporus CBS 931.73]